MSAGSAYKEGTPLAPLRGNLNQSYQRLLEVTGSCTDANNNQSDFFIRSPSKPQNSDSPLGTCDTPTQTATQTPTATATATNTPFGKAAGVVISEFRTRGPRGANDEFIEIYNPTTHWVDISGWKINASNSSGVVGTRATIPISSILRSGQYYLIANNNSNGGYNSSPSANLTYGTGIADNGGIAI
jgi:hypothetical protein